MAPSQSMSPSESGYQELEAEVAVPVRSSTLMDKPTIAVFETTTMNFIKKYVESDTVVITSVKVTDQTLEERRLSETGGRDLQVTDLKVNILVKAVRYVGTSTEPYSLDETIERSFRQHYEDYASDLIDSSSFFRVGFRVEEIEGDSSKSGSPLTGSTLIIVCAVAGCALFVLFSAFLVWRIHSRSTRNVPNRSMGLPSWKSQDISAGSSGYISNESMESPTESDIYTRQSSRRSLFSEKDSHGSGSQRSMLSERSDSPTVGSPYNTEEKTIDVSMIC